MMTIDPPGDRRGTMTHGTEAEYAYPQDLAARGLSRWHVARAAGQISLPAPDISALARLLSTCYQATLLREEGRPVTFRLAIGGGAGLCPAAGPPPGAPPPS